MRPQRRYTKLDREPACRRSIASARFAMRMLAHGAISATLCRFAQIVTVNDSYR